MYQSFSPYLVERRGFEPLTSTMRTLRATNCANAPNFLGKFCADSPLTARPTFTVLGIKYGRLVLPTALMPHLYRNPALLFKPHNPNAKAIIARHIGICKLFLENIFVLAVRVSNIGYTQSAARKSREGWRFAKQIRPDLD